MQLNRLFAIISGVAMMVAYQFCTPNSVGSDPDVQEKIEATPRFVADEFNPPEDVLDMSFAHNVKIAWKFLFGGNDRTPDGPLPAVPVQLSHFKQNCGNCLNATWLGHSSLMINIDGYRILTDPVFQKRISIFGPTRFAGDLPIRIDRLPRIDAVIISHDHYDHLNRWSIQQLAAKTTTFIVPLAVGAHLVKWGVKPDRIVELDWWERHTVDDDLVVTAAPARHFSGRGLTDRNKSLWASWVLAGPHHRIFFSGDSGYFSGFKRIGDTYGPFDMTFLECGAYDRMWHHVHMLPEETLQAHLDLKGELLQPIHWGTFNLALHPWYEPMQRITQAAERNRVDLALPMIGETIRYEQPVRKGKWWQHAMLEN
jgi:L-ascorbate metabolism protein UlaG (beta-lactamase superfamily)